MSTENNILVVDDNEAFLSFVTLVLQDEGYKVQVAINGREAASLLEVDLREKIGLPRLILFDLIMPEMDGIEFMKYLQAKKELRDIPRICVTAVISPEKRPDISQLCQDFLHKPFELETLLGKVKYQIGRLK